MNNRLFGLSLLSFGLFWACASSPLQMAWDQAFFQALDAEDPHALLELGTRAPSQADEVRAKMAAGKLLKQSAPLSSALLFRELSEHARARQDRARAHYELARLSDELGRDDKRDKIFRALVLTYPDLMPGVVAIKALYRTAKKQGDKAVDRHLAWTKAQLGPLKDSELVDNLFMQAADEALFRSKREGEPQKRLYHHAAKRLYERLARDFRGHSLWDDALWELSLIYHQEGRYEAEVQLLERLQSTRGGPSFFGQNDHVYLYTGLKRMARVYQVDLQDYENAIESRLRYVSLYPKSRHHAAMYFYALCSALLNEDAEQAASFAETMKELHPKSRYTKRLPQIMSQPEDPLCVPSELP